MNQETTAIDRVNFLTQSPVRVRILDRLAEQGSLDKRALAEDLAGCRTTVQRNVTALEERGWVENTYPEYTLTAAGELVHEYAAAMLDGVQLVKKLDPLLEHVPADDLGFDVQALADATVVTADETNPYAPVNRHVAAMQAADEFRALLPAVGLQPMTAGRECVARGQRQALIVDDRVAATLRDDETYQAVLDDLLAADTCDLLVTDTDLPYYLGLCADCIQLGLEDADGTPVALIESDAPEVREWAEQRYAAARERATPFAERSVAEAVPTD